MKPFKEYITEGKVKIDYPDSAMAKSLFLQARIRLADLNKLQITDKNASFRFESAYETIREAVQSAMAKEGYKPYSHEATVSYAADKNILNESETATFDRYREIRNDINYRGEKTTIQNAKEAIKFAKKVLSKIRNL